MLFDFKSMVYDVCRDSTEKPTVVGFSSDAVGYPKMARFVFDNNLTIFSLFTRFIPAS
jgi:hypothetical protein